MPSQRLVDAVTKYVKELGGPAAYKKRRERCQQDLWFLSKEIFHRDLFKRVHQPVIDFFIPKVPFEPAFKKDSTYSLKDVHAHIESFATLEKRKGLLLYPRGSYKSTIDSDDCVQWIINIPDIRILIMVGEGSLGEAFIPEIKERFVLEKDREPTEFQKLFYEFVIDLETDKNLGGEQEYWCPLRRHSQVAPTLGSISILGSTSGWHCDVLKCDDVITDTTPIETAQARNKIKRKFVTVSNLLDPHGVLELIGTRYHEEDLYDHIKTSLKECRHLLGGSWTVLPHARHKKLAELLETDVVLLFPERQGFAFLREKLLLDEQTFCLQQLNDPKLAGPSVKFRLEDLRAATVRVPTNPSFRRYNFWDVATTDSEGSDYTAGGFVSIDTSKWIAYLHVLVVDKFTPSELAFQIASLAKQTDPERVFFEKYKDTSEIWLEQEVRRIGVTMNYPVPVHAFKTDKTKMAKGTRICGLEPLIRGGRLFFSNLIPNIEMLYKQFTDFKGVPNPKRHDDIPDMLSFLRMVLPMVGMNMPELPPAGIDLRLRQVTNADSNAALMAQRDKGGNQIFSQLFNKPSQPVTVAAPATGNEGYFPGQ